MESRFKDTVEIALVVIDFLPYFLGIILVFVGDDVISTSLLFKPSQIAVKDLDPT